MRMANIRGWLLTRLPTSWWIKLVTWRSHYRPVELHDEDGPFVIVVNGEWIELRPSS